MLSWTITQVQHTMCSAHVNMEMWEVYNFAQGKMDTLREMLFFPRGSILAQCEGEAGTRTQGRMQLDLRPKQVWTLIFGWRMSISPRVA